MGIYDISQIIFKSALRPNKLGQLIRLCIKRVKFSEAPPIFFSHFMHTTPGTDLNRPPIYLKAEVAEIALN